MDSKQHTQPSSTVAPKPRIEFVDLAKGFCIILVVLFHLQLYMAYYTPFDWMARSFRMPLYFILSGLFFKEYEGFLGFLKRKTNKLLIPFLAFYLLSNLVLPFLGSLVGLCSFNWKMPFAFFLERSWPNVAIWFLWCLFSMNLAFYTIVLIAKKGNKYKIAIMLALSFLLGAVGYTLSQKQVQLPFFWDTACTAMPFFCMGYIMNKYTDILRPNKFDKYILPMILVLALATKLLANNTLDYKNNIYLMSFPRIYICGICGTLCVLFIAKVFKRIPFISYWGRYSIIILVTHYELRPLFVETVRLLGLPEYATLIISLVLMMFSYMLIIPLMIKFFGYVTAQKDVIEV